MEQLCCKTQQVLQNATTLLQNVRVITKCDIYYKTCRYKDRFKNQRRISTWTKKVILFPEIAWVKIFSSFTHPHSRMCIRIYIFRFKQKKHIQTKSKKKLKKKEKQKKPKKKKRNKMLLLTIPVENLTRDHDIV